MSKYYYKVGGGCVLCLVCYFECPVKAIRILEDDRADIDAEKCIGCGSCYNNCQTSAIVRVEREEK